ncbi:LAME_0G01288g1_1 [Lachancea meyersii CBS 8951]|uniref:LAME_0G01288g1_1 n=1 Tax=Lachancea meyersii CBS 8951 TaxID=1266667 RepID=A0A1G4K5D7_9SACH|nr:LAME_0G01288g1_1 [Lachancea meyersii CBS 8951]
MDSYERKIGCFIQIPNVGRGQLKYVGSVDGKPGTFVGVDLLANIGKNDGTFQGKRYFETEYTQSGLFIQLQKVAGLIDAATLGNSSRRTTFGETHAGDSRMSEMSIAKSPTPLKPGSRHSSTAYSDAMDVDGEERRQRSISSQLNRGSNLELRFQQQTQELLHCRKLLSEQQTVLEEIHPAIDNYESKLQQIESQNATLEAQLAKERETLSKQKQYFETEHEQLLSVVEELHTEIRENERRMLEVQQAQQAQPPLPTDSTIAELQAENDALREEVETLKRWRSEQSTAAAKWEKERDQFKLQNESLSSEYQYISRELQESLRKQDQTAALLVKAQAQAHAPALVTNANSPDPNPQVEKLKLQLATANAKVKALESSSRPSTPALTTASDPAEQEPEPEPNVNLQSESLPLFIPKKADRAAGRQKWCALCERDGHNSVDCPYENDQLF